MISIVITNHNYARFLSAAIESALCQVRCDCEVIVVDDGSTDHSRDIIQGYGTRIVPILQAQGGQASAFNRGFEACHSAGVIFLDADDVLLPDIAYRVAQVFQAQPSVAIVQYRMRVIDAQGNQTGVSKPPPHLPLLSGDLRRHAVNFPDDLTWMATSGNAFSAAVLRRIFPIPAFDYGQVGADWYLSHLTRLFGPVVSLDQVGAYYRVHESNYYEQSTSDINIARVRQTILYSRTTHAYIQKYAEQLGIETRPDRQGDLLSTSYIANRLISLRLDPGQHPLAGDTASGLFILGIRAARRRFDISPVMQVMFVVWFALMAVVPKFLARPLAVKFMFPETRGSFNRWLGALHPPR